MVRRKPDTETFILISQLSVPRRMNAAQIQLDIEALSRKAGLAATLQHENIFKASGSSIENINMTLQWILGYFDNDEPNLNLLSLINTDTSKSIEIDLIPKVAALVQDKFRYINDNLIQTLLVFGYSLGGIE